MYGVYYKKAQKNNAPKQLTLRNPSFAWSSPLNIGIKFNKQKKRKK